jgi:hypothetical protein
MTHQLAALTVAEAIVRDTTPSRKRTGARGPRGEVTPRARARRWWSRRSGGGMLPARWPAAT